MTDKKEAVILLHGIADTMINMVAVEHVLKKQGYDAYNITYPSLKHDIKTLSLHLKDVLEEKNTWSDYDKVHFVTHSMGGLVSGFYLQDHKGEIPEEKMGRVIMLGTPHGGSEVADALCNLWAYKVFYGPAGQELTTHARKENQIEPWYELGVIAGTQDWLKKIGEVFSMGPHDGCVSIESTKLEGMSDHIILPIHHSIMGLSPQIHKQIIVFLQQGRFHHDQ